MEQLLAEPCRIEHDEAVAISQPRNRHEDELPFAQRAETDWALRGVRVAFEGACTTPRRGFSEALGGIICPREVGDPAPRAGKPGQLLTFKAIQDLFPDCVFSHCGPSASQGVGRRESYRNWMTRRPDTCLK